jgi:Resolvase, N terminal domain
MWTLQGAVKPVRCAIYTRVSTEHGLDQEFNSLDAQYDAASAYIKSQAHAGWTLIRSRYDDGGYSGGSTDRPDLQRLLEARNVPIPDRLNEVGDGGGGPDAPRKAIANDAAAIGWLQLQLRKTDRLCRYHEKNDDGGYSGGSTDRPDLHD